MNDSAAASLVPEAERPTDEYRNAFLPRGFSLLRRIGSGASGAVYGATQVSLDREVAIKLFDHPLTSKDAAQRKRFEREARLLARVSHPGVPVVLTRGEVLVGQAVVPYLVMELIQGETLQQMLAQLHRLEVPAAIHVVVQVLSALGAVHRSNIVHRDVKPANVMIDGDDTCHLIDFSIGVSLEVASGLTRVTREGGVPGTELYMAPEQRVGRDVDGRADLFSTGVVLFELLVGHAQVKLATLDEQLKGFPADLRDVVRRACQEEPDARYENAQAFSQALQGLSTGVRARGAAATGLCINPKCPGARWTPNGYYEGPRILSGTADSFCDTCGEKLTFPCVRCGREYGNTEFCGGCGQRAFQVPVCQQCGSWLTVQDMGADTAAAGCGKCRRKAHAQPVFSDEDTPF